MKRFRWKKPWHYIILLADGYLFGFGVLKSIEHYPDFTWMIYAAIGVLSFVTWIMIDVFPSN